MSNKEFLDFEGLAHYDEKIKEYIDMSDEAIFDYFGVDFETGTTASIETSAYAQMIKDAVVAAINNDDSTIDSIPESDINDLFS